MLRLPSSMAIAPIAAAGPLVRVAASTPGELEYASWAQHLRPLLAAAKQCPSCQLAPKDRQLVEGCPVATFDVGGSYRTSNDVEVRIESWHAVSLNTGLGSQRDPGGYVRATVNGERIEWRCSDGKLWNGSASIGNLMLRRRVA